MRRRAESDDQRPEAREGRAENPRPAEVTDHRNRAAHQSGDSGHDAFPDWVLEQGNIEAELFARLRLQPDLLVGGDSTDDGCRFLRSEPLRAIDLDDSARSRSGIASISAASLASWPSKPLAVTCWRGTPRPPWIPLKRPSPRARR